MSQIVFLIPHITYAIIDRSTSHSHLLCCLSPAPSTDIDLSVESFFAHHRYLVVALDCYFFRSSFSLTLCGFQSTPLHSNPIQSNPGDNKTIMFKLCALSFILTMTLTDGCLYIGVRDKELLPSGPCSSIIYKSFGERANLNEKSAIGMMKKTPLVQDCWENKKCGHLGLQDGILKSLRRNL
ncbi:unnamed protein product [Lactuca saligna]|uniref:Uncharacterized protein n=1 Tax=Lactuca saligna TaxID=75948 RepID=A0AA35ZRM6_LACSI|nr:unnamed protein product [Lactuca saligna]